MERQIKGLLQKVAEQHHRAFASVNGDDPNWADWYADWLINHSALPEFLGSKPAKEELAKLLAGMDKDFRRQKPAEKWEHYYARQLVKYFAAKQLIFVYNAKSGFIHGVMGLIHKSARPKTYPCKLCQITYSGITMNKIWKNYVAGLNIPSAFLHKNEFERTYPSVKIQYPAVLLKRNKSLKMVLSTEDLGRTKDLDDLINKLNERLPDAKDE